MKNGHKPGLIERIAERLHVIPTLSGKVAEESMQMTEPGPLSDYPPPEKWDSWTEYDSATWPLRRKRDYVIVPTSCFNCESGCGLLSYIDKETMRVQKFEGNPYHPGSRGRNCAKGPATINQINDVDRILYPLRRKGPRGNGNWERVSWDEVLDDISSRIRKALQEKRNNEIVYHVGRPGHEGYMDRVLQSWGVDGHNSHTNICSAGARFGYALWHGFDRPSPDHANARFILLISAHLESGHYFNPHAQRIIEAKMNGAQIAVLDPRLSNTASMADHWLPTYPGSEAAVLLAMAKIILDETLFDATFMRQWVNWEDYLRYTHPDKKPNFDTFIAALKDTYAEYTPEFAEQESGVPADEIVEVARKVGQAGSRLATHNWRSAGSGNLGGWAVARALHFLNVLTGSVGTPGGTSPSGWNKSKPNVFSKPPAQKFWNELHFPNEYPLSHYEMSFLLPHFLKEGRGKLDVYFTRVFNPVWTYPDGFSWIEALQDEDKIGLHIAMTPTWNETAYFADYVLPMGHASERHDFLSYETHNGVWVAFRQPVLREAARRNGQEVEFTYESNPGEVWEEDEFWIELSWRIDPDGTLGIKKHFESPYRQGSKIKIEEYYRYIFEHIKGLPERAAQEGLSPLDFMRKYGAFEVEKNAYGKHLNRLDPDDLKDATQNPETKTWSKNGKVVGIEIDGEVVTGFPTPSRKQEFFSHTMIEWGWPEYSIPTYVKSHIHPENIRREEGEFPLVPTFRLPTLIHSRSGNAKWLHEISNRNPVWMHRDDARRLGLKDGDLIKITTGIGYFIDKIWMTEGIKPGIVACSHHLGRWRRSQDPEANIWAAITVEIDRNESGKWKMRQTAPISRRPTHDADTSRIFWSDGGVHQNITFPVHPDPVSGMHCWHQKVKIEKAGPDDRYGDIRVDTKKSMQIYEKWLAMTRPASSARGLRRPLWFNRPLRPDDSTFKL